MKKVFKVLIVVVFAGLVLSPSVAFARPWYDYLNPAVWIEEALTVLITYLIIPIFQGILWLSGVILDISVWHSVANFKTYVEGAEIVNIGWTIARDLVNVVLIFVVLYIAVTLILQLGERSGKRLLLTVLLVALLVNFSAFFTRVVIDFTNVLANTFYQQISPGDNIFDKINPISGKGIGWRFVSYLRLQENFKTPGEAVKAKKENLTFGQVVTKSAGLIVMMLITSFVFFTAAILFLIRMVTLTILIVLSPLAFLAYALPGKSDWGKKWMTKLINESLLAPFLLFFLYVIARALGEGAITRWGEGGANDWQTLSVQAFNFIIIIGLMIASLVFAKSLSAAGAGMAMKLAGAATGGLTAAGVWAAKQPLRGAGRLLGAADEKLLGGRMSKIYGGLKGSLGTAARTVGKVPGVGPLGRKVGEIVKHPIAAGAAGLAAATAAYGVPSILGRGTKEEEEKAKKENRRLEVAGIQNRLKGLKGEKDVSKAREKAFELMKEVKPNEMAEHFSDDVLTMPAVIASYTPHTLQSFARTGVKGKVMTAIFDEIQKPENRDHPARGYVQGTLARSMWWRPQTPPPPAPTTREGGGPKIIVPEGLPERTPEQKAEFQKIQAEEMKRRTIITPPPAPLPPQPPGEGWTWYPKGQQAEPGREISMDMSGRYADGAWVRYNK